MPNAVNGNYFSLIIYRIEDAVVADPDTIAILGAAEFFSAGRSRLLIKLINCFLNRIIVGRG